MQILPHTYIAELFYSSYTALSYSHQPAPKPRAKRELTEEELEEKQRKEDEKAAAAAIVEQHHEALETQRAAQAEARLNYLLKQHDIFEFIKDGSKKGQGSSALQGDLQQKKDAEKANGKKSKHRRETSDDEVSKDLAIKLACLMG